MDNKEWFREQDEQERIYAPQQLPADQQGRVLQDEGRIDADPNEPPLAAPVASVGAGHTGMAAPPNLGHVDQGGAPGDPATEAGYPIGDGDGAGDDTP